MSILKTKWKCDDLKQVHLSYRTGKIEISNWSLEIDFFTEVNNIIIGKLKFNHKTDSSMSGSEFVTFIHNKNLNKIIGSDSNGYYEGYFNNNKLQLDHISYEHIKFPQNGDFINSFSNKFKKL